MQSHIDLRCRKTPIWKTALTVTVFLFKTTAAFEKSFIRATMKSFQALPSREQSIGLGLADGTGFEEARSGLQAASQKVLLGTIHGRT